MKWGNLLFALGVAAAILCTVLVLLLGFAAKIFVIGEPLDPDGVAVSADPEDPTRCLVDFSFTVAHGLNQIWLTAHITV